MKSNTSKQTHFLYKNTSKSSNWIEPNQPTKMKLDQIVKIGWRRMKNLGKNHIWKQISNWDDEHKLDEKTGKQISHF